MPTSNTTSSPVKRPGLGRRAVSSHAVVTRANPNDLSESHTQKAPVHHKAHRAHVVGGHRNHHRNPSVGKNLTKLQRFQLAQLGPETTGRHHQRKKSAPATPIASPKEGGHIRWDNVVDNHPTAPSMKRNYSTPALRRNNSAVGKKALVTERPHSSAAKKKTVGFELGDDDDVEVDDADWEDTTQSPESTRRNSVVPSNHSADNTTILVDPLTFVKRPYPQIARATSLPESITSKFARERAELEESQNQEEDEDHHDSDNDSENSSQHTEQGDIATRLLSPSHSAKAPPAMSSISAMVKPAAKDPASRSSASLNLAAGQESARRTYSTANMASMPGSHPNATSSSMEGGVSRFIMNNKNSIQASSRTDSDPNTPSSFLPHYHPQTPPSPGRAPGKSTASPARPRGADLPSRTQQKLWLQRTATLNNSPPDSHGVPPSTAPSTVDPTFNSVNNTRTGGVTFDTSRGLASGGRAGGAGHDGETRHIRKAYEKTSLELTVVRRFQSPAGESFARLRHVARAAKVAQTSSALGKPVKSAPSLPLLQQGKRPSRLSSSPASKPVTRNPTDAEDLANGNPAKPAKSNDPSARILSTSAEASRDLTGENEVEDYQVNDVEMMIRRIWESREVATHG